MNTEKQQKVAKLIVLLINIEKELSTVETTLNKLVQAYVDRQDGVMVGTINEKLDTIARLKTKITRARLNLNYHFI